MVGHVELHAGAVERAVGRSWAVCVGGMVRSRERWWRRTDRRRAGRID